jgi:hypothetical protein
MKRCVRIIPWEQTGNMEAGKITVSWDVTPCSLMFTNVLEECATSIFRVGNHPLDYKAPPTNYSMKTLNHKDSERDHDGYLDLCTQGLSLTCCLATERCEVLPKWGDRNTTFNTNCHDIKTKLSVNYHGVTHCELIVLYVHPIILWCRGKSCNC